jgi:hypothetical protein
MTGGWPVESSVSLSRISFLRPPALSAWFRYLPSPVCPGGTQLVVLSVSNSGQVEANAVFPSPLAVGGAGTVTVMAGPRPGSPVTVAPRLTASFTWTVAGVAAGPVGWSTTLGGTDGLLGSALPDLTVTGDSSVWANAVLSGSLSVPPSAYLCQWITVVLTVIESGGGPAYGLRPAGPFPSLPGRIVSGPEPTGPVDLPPGGTAAFSWTFSVSGAGALGWSVTVSGAGCAAIPVSMTTSASTTVWRPAILEAALSASASVLVAGQSVTVVLTVTNTGETQARSVLPSLKYSSIPLSILSGPPPGSLPLSPGGSASFTWTLSPAIAGTLWVGASAGGTDANTRWPVESWTAYASMAVLARANLIVEEFTIDPRPSPAGQPVTATLRLRNTGGVAAVVDTLVPGVLSSPAGMAGPPGAAAPALPLTLAPGAVATFTWTVSTTACGAVRMTATINGTETVSGRTLGPIVAVSLPAGIYASPASLRFLPGTDSGPCRSDVGVEVVVEDSCGIPVPGRAVDLAVLSGGAAPHSGTAVSDISGKVRFTVRLGLDLGPNLLRASLQASMVSATGVVTALLPSEALTEPGAALDRNVFSSLHGESVLVRVFPVNDDPVVVRIHSASGRLIRTLRSLQPVGGGRWSVLWDGRTEDEFITVPGVYLVHVTGGGLRDLLKVVVR